MDQEATKRRVWTVESPVWEVLGEEAVTTHVYHKVASEVRDRVWYVVSELDPLGFPGQVDEWRRGQEVSGS